MKKIIRLGIMGLAALLVVLSCISCKAKTETTFEPEGTSKGELTLGFDAEYPPYGYLDTETNQYVGFDIDFAKAVCNKLGYTLNLRPIVWETKDSALETGEIDFIWNGFTMNGREDDYEWTCPYVDNTIVVLTKADSGITTLADLAGKTVTVQADSSGENALKNEENAALVASFNGGKYLTCKDYTTAYQDLTAGAVDAIVIDIGVANYFAGEEDVILEESIFEEQYGVGFYKGNTALRDEIQGAMIELATTTDLISQLCETYGIDEEAVVLGK